MTKPKGPEDETPGPLGDLGARLRVARERARGGKGTGGDESGARLSGAGLAFRVGVELISALIVGAGLGRLIDIWLGTGPWGLVVLFFFGAGAGILNVYRTVARMGTDTGSEPGNPPE
jgi:ATP synthase protein I